jgi:hypothetical protein
MVLADATEKIIMRVYKLMVQHILVQILFSLRLIHIHLEILQVII